MLPLRDSSISVRIVFSHLEMTTSISEWPAKEGREHSGIVCFLQKNQKSTSRHSPSARVTWNSPKCFCLLSPSVTFGSLIFRNSLSKRLRSFKLAIINKMSSAEWRSTYENGNQKQCSLWNSYALVISVSMETALSPEAERMRTHQDMTYYVSRVN